VNLQRGGARRPFFFVHGAAGGVTCYRDLAGRLGPDQPVWAFGATGGHSGRTIRQGLPALAAAYVRELCAVDPEGPYQLAGWSLGGVLAFEMAQQLRRAGREVSLLVLLDSSLPGKDRPLPDPGQFLVEFTRQHRLEVPPDLAGRPWHQRLDGILELAWRAGVFGPGFTTHSARRLLLQHILLFQASLRAVRRYEPQPWPGRVVLFCATDRPGGPSLPVDVWSPLAAEVEAHVVPGDHYSILGEPHVGLLAELLGDHLGSGRDR
jgi:thioesterase domain-containing protein